MDPQTCRESALAGGRGHRQSKIDGGADTGLTHRALLPRSVRRAGVRVQGLMQRPRKLWQTLKLRLNGSRGHTASRTCLALHFPCQPESTGQPSTLPKCNSSWRAVQISWSSRSHFLFAWVQNLVGHCRPLSATLGPWLLKLLIPRCRNSTSHPNVP